jgi:hypothetical protein
MREDYLLSVKKAIGKEKFSEDDVRFIEVFLVEGQLELVLCVEPNVR